MMKSRRYLLLGLLGIAVFLFTTHAPHVNDYFNDEYQILSNHKVVSNISVQRYPKVLNYNPSGNILKFHSNYLFNYFLQFEYVDFGELQGDDVVVTGIRRGLPDKIEEKEVYQSLGHDLYISTTAVGHVADDTPIVRSLDVFYNVVKDSRDYWHTVPLKSRYLSVFKLSEAEADSHLHILKVFDNFKQNQLINLNIDKSNKDSRKTFKIFQVSDLHLWNGQLDSLTETFLVDACNSQLPNLIIINGDLLEFTKANINEEAALSLKNNIKADEDSLSTILFNCLNLFIRLKIPYIINFGESDYKSPNSMRFLKFISNLPYCLNSYDNLDQSLNGLTNYNFKLYLNNEIIGVVSILDSYNNEISSNQINSIYKFNSLNQVNNIFKLAFVHYPLPNFRPVGKFKIVGTYSKMDPLVTNTDKSVLNDFINLNYNVISASHEHENDGCILHNNNGNKDSDNNKDINDLNNKIWLCYSSVAGAHAKTEGDVDRKLRVFEITGNRLLSWKISEKSGKAYDYQLIHQLS